MHDQQPNVAPAGSVDPHLQVHVSPASELQQAVAAVDTVYETGGFSVVNAEALQEIRAQQGVPTVQYNELPVRKSS